MTNIQRYMMKLAEEPSVWEKTKKFVGGLGEGGIRYREYRTIKGQLKKTKPKTKKERAVEQLAGKEYTPGQYARRAGIGAIVGAGAQGLGTVIEGKSARAAGGLKPRALGRAAAVGALFGSAIPAASRLADIEAAKRGAF